MHPEAIWRAGVTQEPVHSCNWVKRTPKAYPEGWRYFALQVSPVRGLADPGTLTGPTRSEQPRAAPAIDPRLLIDILAMITCKHAQDSCHCTHSIAIALLWTSEPLVLLLMQEGITKDICKFRAARPDGSSKDK